jgi:UDP-glucuronate 4-epimerase
VAVGWSGDAKAMPRYLVTGCAGFIGSTLTDTLLADGCEVVGVDAFTDYYPRAVKEAAIARALNHGSFEMIEHDLGAGPPPERALERLDGIYHLAARPGVRASWGSSFTGYVYDNMLGAHTIAEAAAGRGVRLAFASSSSIYGDALAYPTSEETPPAPISPYGVTKLACEHLIAAHAKNLDLDAVTLRYFTVYGPRQRPDMAFSRIAAAIARRERFEVYGDGRQSRDFTYVDDAVAATIAALRSAPAGAVYNVGGGSEATLRDVVALAEELSGQSLDVGFGEAAPGDVRRTLADTTRIRDELGWRPRVDLRAGLAAELEAVGAMPRAAPPR